jgi:glycosyltransferase involved in cell wall biosynthesis
VNKSSKIMAIKTVDVIVVAKNEESYIGLCLESLFNQESRSYKLSINIIVVDNGSTDETSVVAKSYTENIFYKPDLTLAEARNFGVSRGDGEYVAFIDADCSCAENWLDSAISCLENKKAGAVGGPCVLPENTTAIERAWVVPGDADFLIEMPDLATSSFITKRDTIYRVGGFKASLGAGEDTDLSLKIKADVGPLFSAWECRVVHYGYPKTIWEFVKREFWHGYWEAKRTSGKSRILVISNLFVILLVVGFIALMMGRGMVAIIIMLISMVIPIALSVKKLSKGKPVLSWDESFLLVLLNVVYLLVRSLAGVVVLLCNLHFCKS